MASNSTIKQISATVLTRRLAIGSALWGGLVATGAAVYQWLLAPSGLHWLWFGIAALVLAWLCIWLWLRRLERQILALNLHADSLKDQSFNLAANQQLLFELAPLGQALNSMAAELAQQRASLYQRELLLDTVLQTSPAGLVLTDERDRVLLSNPAARSLLSHGQRFDGADFATIVAPHPVLQKACVERKQGLVHLADESIWHIAVSQFQLNQRHHWLYLFKPMTRELQQEELKAWKKLLRVIGHELNNSLAPMSSLAFSGQRLLGQFQRELAASFGDLPADVLQQSEQLSRIFTHLAERSQQLNQFLQGYLEFARLPPPKRQPVAWATLVNQLQDHYEFELQGDLPRHEWQLDPMQLSQLLLNLLKNAKEAGASDQGTLLTIRETPQALQLLLQDDAGGMSDEVFAHAMLPFYTTKAHGSGIGLALCRDIMESHGGTMELRNFANGLQVSLIFPRETSIR